VVTRSRQRERENESNPYHEEDWEWSKFVNRPSRPTQIYFHVPSPVVEFVPEPPAPKRIKKTLTDPSAKLTRAQKATKQRDMKPGKGWHWTDYYKNSLEWRTVSRNVEFFSNPLNYYWDRSWMIRRCEFQYEGENDPLEE
jgi:hypothetical protein